MARIIHVLPGELRLPATRQAGADPFKLAEQIRRFGSNIEGVPPLFVILGADGEMVIIDGVTRATRVARQQPAATIPVEIIEERPSWSLKHFRRVKETL